MRATSILVALAALLSACSSMSMLDDSNTQTFDAQSTLSSEQVYRRIMTASRKCYPPGGSPSVTGDFFPESREGELRYTYGANGTGVHVNFEGANVLIKPTGAGSSVIMKIRRPDTKMRAAILAWMDEQPATCPWL